MTLTVNKINTFDLYNSQYIQQEACTPLWPVFTQDLKEALRLNFTAIVQSTFFNTHFKEMLDSPGPDPIRLDITITDQMISVHKQGTETSADKEVPLVSDKPEELNALKTTIKTIFDKALATQQKSIKVTPISPDNYQSIKSDIEIPSSTAPVKMQESIQQLYELAQLFTSIGSSTSVPPLMLKRFEALPTPIKNKIYYETFLLVGTLNRDNDLQFGEHIFLASTPPEKQQHPFTHAERCMAIHHYIMKYLAAEYAAIGSKPVPQELEALYNMLPDLIRRDIGPVVTLAPSERSQAIHAALINLLSDFQHHLFNEQFDIEMRVRASELEKERAAADLHGQELLKRLNGPEAAKGSGWWRVASNLISDKTKEKILSFIDPTRLLYYPQGT